MPWLSLPSTMWCSWYATCKCSTLGLVLVSLQAGTFKSSLSYLPSTLQGMGEPLNNYAAVRSAVSLMTDNGVFALRRTAVTVSTVGVVHRIEQLCHDLPGISLALSLHAPTQVCCVSTNIHMGCTLVGLMLLHHRPGRALL